jgi:putative transposase
MADYGFSKRRAYRLIGVNQSAWQYEPLRGKDDAVRERIREIANERRRFGYRRLAILLRREGKGINLKKVYQLYREERLTVRKRGGRKRALGTQVPMAIPQGPNQRWSLDPSTSSGEPSYRMHWPAAGGFACSTSSTTTAGNVWHASSTPRCQAGVSSRARRHRQASRAAVHGGQRQRDRTDQLCRSCLVPEHRGPNGITSLRASRSRTALWIVQWSLARRMPERAPVPLTGCAMILISAE